MSVEVEVQRISKSENIPQDEQFQLWAEAVLTENHNDSSVVIRLVDEQEAQQLNLRYRDKDYATNVLSFPADLPAGLPAEIRDSQLGDLLLCVAVVKREALEQHRSESDHWAHLTIHGILHLLGYDHLQSEEALVMETLETDLLAKLGISDPYLILE
jgi:probable rRNA maturation factor